MGNLNFDFNYFLLVIFSFEKFICTIARSILKKIAQEDFSKMGYFRKMNLRIPISTWHASNII